MKKDESLKDIYLFNDIFVLDHMVGNKYVLVEMDDQIQAFLGEGSGSLFEDITREMPYDIYKTNQLTYDPLKKTRESLENGEYNYLVWDDEEEGTRNVIVKFEVLESNKNIFLTIVKVTSVENI